MDHHSGRNRPFPQFGGSSVSEAWSGTDCDDGIRRSRQLLWRSLDVSADHRVHVDLSRPGLPGQHDRGANGPDDRSRSTTVATGIRGVPRMMLTSSEAGAAVQGGEEHDTQGVSEPDVYADGGKQRHARNVRLLFVIDQLSTLGGGERAMIQM